MKPVVDRLEKAYAGKVTFVRIGDDATAEQQRLAETFGVRYVPTFVFVKADGAKTATLIGEQSEETMRSNLDAIAR